MDLSIRPCPREEIARFEPLARKAGLTFCQSTEYWIAFDGEQVVGFCGVIYAKSGRKAKFKNAYVLPAYRGRGVYRQMFDLRVAVAKARGCEVIEATCTEMSVRQFLKHGCYVVRKYKNGLTAVEIPL